MKYLVPILVLFTFLSVQYCKSTKELPTEYQGKQLIFGSGGGVAGLYTEYFLFENGQFFKKSTTNNTFEKLKKVKKQTTKQLFNNYQVLNLGEVDFNHPSNMTYYIKMKNADQKHEIQWGDANNPIDEQIKLYYQLLMELTK